MSKHEIVQPAGWPRPRGYANGVAARGRQVFVAGQIGWDASEQLVGEDLASQFRQALANVRAVVEAAGGSVEDIVRLTIYCTDVPAYRQGVAAIGAAYREVLGKHFPAMALLGISELVHPGAKVEIEATAMIEEGSDA
ncbi:MAG: RidA family protein [Myxococcales bacterium]|nr:RidA family protein [Myxococcales bacterium]